jgi:UDPglucose--hexose-1-phosphate uridylyltransferase
VSSLRQAIRGRCPPYRTAEKLKYLAGTELAAGLFVMDALPEDKALELQKVAVDIGQS